MTSSFPPPPTGVSRRSVVRVAAHSAWIAPAISVVAAAPAFAASGPASLSVLLGTVSTNATTASFPFTLTNANTQASTALQLTVAVTLRDPTEWGVGPTATSTISSAPGAGTPVSSVKYSFLLVATTQVPGSATNGGVLSGTVVVDHGASGPTTNAPLTAAVELTADPGGGGTAGYMIEYT